MNLDNLTDIKDIDRNNMLGLLTDFPKQCEDAFFIGERSGIRSAYKRKYANILFTGLGGSAIGADIVKGYVDNEIKAPIVVNRDYTLPAFAGRDSLVFAVSYSGNTEETLSSYAEAKKKNANVIVITSGGKLRELASKNDDSLIVIPTGYPPRCALGYSFIPALAVLSRIGLIKSKAAEIKKAARFLGSLEKEKLGPNVREKRNVSKYTARSLYGRFPVIYASNRLGSVATRFRGQLAENSKTISSSHVFPEMNHNEIVGWVNPRALIGNFTAVMLKDKGDHARVKRRMEITSQILEREGFNVLELESLGKSFLERMLSLIYIGDFASFYLSILNRIDPTPVDRVTYLKKQLARPTRSVSR